MVANPRSFGVSSKSAAPLRMNMPGLTKFGCPSSLFVRRSGSRLTGRLEAGAGLREAEPLAVPEAERAARERRDVEDRVEAASLVVGRIAVARARRTPPP